MRDLDDIFLELGTADRDLFKAMTSVGDGLENESRVVVNMLLAGERAAATKRIAKAEVLLTPLVSDLNKGVAELNRLSGDLGIG